MIAFGKKQLHDRAAQFAEPRRIGRYLHAFVDGGHAGRLGPRHAGNFHEANAAAALRRKAVQTTERRNMDAYLLRCGEDRVMAHAPTRRPSIVKVLTDMAFPSMFDGCYVSRGGLGGKLVLLGPPYNFKGWWDSVYSAHPTTPLPAPHSPRGADRRTRYKGWWDSFYPAHPKPGPPTTPLPAPYPPRGAGRHTRCGSIAACSAPDWSPLAKPAKACVSHHVAERLQPLDVGGVRSPLNDFGQEAVHLHGARSAWHALAARLVTAELHVEPGHSTMLFVSSMTIMPPEPMIEPSCASDS